ncbi:MAG: peptidase family C69, partial [Acidimicrobiales bacterium]
MCDTFASFDSGGMLFAKNSDRTPNEPQVVEWHPARNNLGKLSTQYLTLPDADTAGVVLSRPTWLFGAEHGVNEHGVAVGNERIFNR